jgi:hypothetical protein
MRAIQGLAVSHQALRLQETAPKTQQDHAAQKNVYRVAPNYNKVCQEKLPGKGWSYPTDADR